MKTIIAACVLALCHVGTASAAPAWCKDANFDDRYDLKDLSSKDVGEVIITFAKATCKPNAEATAAAAQIETARQAWGKKLVMQEADWAEAVAYANVKGRPDWTYALSSKDLSQFTALDQYQVIFFGLGFDRSDYLADMFEPNLTEAGRLAYIEKCLDQPVVAYIPSVAYALCGADVKAFDIQKFGQQISADRAHPLDQKMGMRIRGYNAPKTLETYRKKALEILQMDDGYKKLWEAAAKGRAEFASRMGGRKDLLALATRMDSALFLKSRKMIEGCEAATQEALDKLLAEKVPVSLFKDVKKDIPKNEDKKDAKSVGAVIAPLLIDIPEIAFIAGPYAECHKNSEMASFLTGALYYTPGYRGPRGAAYTAITKEKILLDDTAAKIDYPPVGQPFLSGGSASSTGGVVDSVREEGGMLVVSLPKMTSKGEECVKEHYGNRITRINSDGSLSYEWFCDKWATVTYDVTPKDYRFDLKWKSFLKKGAVFSVMDRSVPTPLVLWPSADAKTPTVMFGQPVKAP